jgi:cysteine desulfurase/selenocysteine lyase
MIAEVGGYLSSRARRRGAHPVKDAPMTVLAADLERLAALRADFPTITADEVFLDSVASSLTPMPVIEAMTEYYTRYRSNIHRGTYDLSMRASERFDAAIAAVAGFLGADTEEIVLTQNTTHALNLVAHSLEFEPGDEIVLTSLEHTSNMAPWVRMVQTKGVNLRWYNAGATGVVDAEELISLIGPKTKLVTCTYVSNVLGTVLPVAEIGKACKERGVHFLIDAAQAAPHHRLDIAALNCDFLAFSGHKMLGPTGIGVLYIRRELAYELTPGMLGGGTIDTAACACPSLDECSLEHCSFSPLPDKWQAGTPPIAEAFGLHAAIEYLDAVGLDSIAEHDRFLIDRLATGLRAIPGVSVYGPEEPGAFLSIVSFNIGDIDPAETGRILNERYRIGVRTGQHCAVNYFNDQLHHGGPAGSVRASVYLYNTVEEIDRTLSAVGEAAAALVG